MRLRVLWVGKTREGWIREGIDDYTARIRRYLPLEITEAREEKGSDPEAMRRREGERILKLLPKNALLVLMDERGEELTSTGLAASLGQCRDRGVPEMVFLIGGAYGFSEELRARGDRTLALSKMTFTHEMARVFLLEQLYRAMTILGGEGYHH